MLFRFLNNRVLTYSSVPINYLYFFVLTLISSSFTDVVFEMDLNLEKKDLKKKIIIIIVKKKKVVVQN